MRDGTCPMVVMLLNVLLFAVPTRATTAITTSSDNCQVPLDNQDLPAPSCPPNSSATLEDAHAIAWTFAPVVYWHPLEKYYLQSMDVWFNATEMHLTDFYPYPNSSYNYIVENAYTEVLLGPRTFVTLLNSTHLSTARRKELLAGAPFDARNESTARVFYTVNDYDDRFWVYNYNLYYSWSGCSNQAVAMSANGTREVSDYLLCPAGVHEADLERVSVLVCKSDRTMKQVAYSQHAWTEVRSCEQGQCPLAAGTGNPIVYAGLESHANYPTSSPLMVYDYRNATATEKVSIANFGGVWFGDRTLANPYRRFVPRPDNIVYLPPLEAIASQNLTEFSWAQYSGNWGAPLRAPQPALYCLNDNETTLEKCPTNTTFAIAVAEMLNLLSVVPGDENLQYSDDTDYTVQEPSKGSLVRYPNNTGPLLRAYSYTWDANSSAPIYQSNTSRLVCPQDIQVQQSIPQGATPTTSVSTVVDYFVWLAVGDVAFSFLLSLLFALPVLLDKTARIHRMAVRKMASMSQFTVQLADAVHVVNAAPGVVIEAVKAAPDAVAGEAAAWVEKLGGNNSIPGGQNAAEAGLAHPPEEEGGDEELALPGFQERHDAASGASFTNAGTEVMELEPVAVEAFNARMFIWITLAAALYIAGIVLLGIGIQQLVTESIISAALNVLHSGSVASTVQRVLAGLLVLIGVADVCVVALLLCMSPRHLRLGKLRVRNYLGGHAWPLRSSFGIHVALISIMALVINTACIFVTLGFFVVVTQLGARIACESFGRVQALGVGTPDVCISLPSLVDGQICGWQALQTCYAVTNMRVAYIVVGAIMQLWCHLIWLIVLVGSLERLRTQVAVVRPGRHAKDEPKDNVD